MTDRLVLPKIPISAEVTLFGGKKITGEFFLSAASRVHAGAETLLELLNDEQRSFIPFQTEDGMLLLNRSAVRIVEFDSEDLLSIFTRPDNEYIYAVKITLRTELQEINLQGFCYTGDMRPEARRPLDLLNFTDMFILLYDAGMVTLLNKNAISHATLE